MRVTPPGGSRSSGRGCAPGKSREAGSFLFKLCVVCMVFCLMLMIGLFCLLAQGSRQLSVCLPFSQHLSLLTYKHISLILINV